MKPWSLPHLEYVEREYGKTPTGQIAAHLRRSPAEVRYVAKAMGLVIRRFWTRADRRRLRELYGTMPIPEIAKLLGRSPTSIYQAAKKCRLTRCLIRCRRSFERFVRAKHRLGWCDPHIAATWSERYPGRVPIERHTVAVRRYKLGLQVNGLVRCGLCKAHVRETTRRQCAAAGVNSLAEVRRLAFDAYAQRNGWPQDLRPRAVQVLNVLATKGPMTKVEIARAIGMRTEGWASRQILKSNDPEGNYLAHLMRRGLVVALGRTYTGGYKWHQTYSLALTAERNGHERAC